MNFRHNVFVIIVSKSAAEFVVVHVGLTLPLAPLPGDVVGIEELELAVHSLPRDRRVVRSIGQELE